VRLGLPDSSAGRQAVLIAMLAMAWQVAAKGTRESLFLAAFLPTDLPSANIVAALCSILMALATARLLRQFGPSRLIPLAFLASMLLHLAEWMLLPSYPRAVPAFTYVHVIAVGPVLLSGFWALASERFDPRQARREVGRITAFGTIGAVAGPLIAERVALLTSPRDLLVFLAVLQGAGLLALLPFAAKHPHETAPEKSSFLDVLSGAPYALRLAGFILLISMSAAALDYVFKVQVYSAFRPGPSQTRFFLLFNAITAAVTFGVQAAVSHLWLRRFGPGRTVAVLPMAVTGAGAVSLLLPGAGTLIVSRAIEQLLRGSLFRSGYELFYTAMPRAEKRAVKPLIDIGADRSGDLLANATIHSLLWMPAGTSFRAILGLATALAAGAAWLALRLDRSYVSVLEKGLRKQTVVVQPEEAEDPLTKSVVLKSLPGRHASAYVPSIAQAAAKPVDPLARRLAELRSGSATRVRAALRDEPPDPVLIPQIINLLGRDEVARPAHEVLVRIAHQIAGQLVDCLADPSRNPKVRRRIPRILVTSGNQIAWDGLIAGLDDEHFEIRQRCARALEKLLQHRPDFRPDQAVVFAVVGRELSRSRLVAPQPGLKEADGEDAGDEGELLVDEVLRERASQRLIFLSTVLGLALPPQSVRLAFRALHTDDPKLRGVALEYLDSVLPQNLRAPFSALFEGEQRKPVRAAAPDRDALATLLDCTPSIMARLQELGFDKPASRTGSARSEGGVRKEDAGD
jgi:ATP:ADP antiporter, AAA family